MTQRFAGFRLVFAVVALALWAGDAANAQVERTPTAENVVRNVKRTPSPDANPVDAPRRVSEEPVAASRTPTTDGRFATRSPDAARTVDSASGRVVGGGEVCVDTVTKASLACCLQTCREELFKCVVPEEACSINPSSTPLECLLKHKCCLEDCLPNCKAPEDCNECAADCCDSDCDPGITCCNGGCDCPPGKDTCYSRDFTEFDLGNEVGHCCFSDECGEPYIGKTFNNWGWTNGPYDFSVVDKPVIDLFVKCGAAMCNLVNGFQNGKMTVTSVGADILITWTNENMNSGSSTPINNNAPEGEWQVHLGCDNTPYASNGNPNNPQLKVGPGSYQYKGDFSENGGVINIPSTDVDYANCADLFIIVHFNSFKPVA